MKQIFTLLCACVFILMSCKKEVGENEVLDPKNQRKYDLMTNKVGSWWLYGSADNMVFRRSATGQDSVKKGLRFSYYLTTDTSTGYLTPEYHGKNGTSYVTLVDIDGSQTEYLTLVFFKDSVNIGQTWTNTEVYNYGAFKIDVRIDSKIEDTGGVMMWTGNTFTSVIRVNNILKWKPQFQSDYITAGKMDIWFVKGIGIIKQDLNANVAGLISKVYRDSLLSYYFEPE